MATEENFIDKWINQGIRQGVQQGVQQGIQQGEANLVLRQLSYRFGKIDAKIESKIRSLPVSVLEELGQALFDFQGLKDLTAWLKKHAK